MATTRTFGDMLNQYVPNKLLKEELVDRVWLFKNAEQDESWLGGTLVVPFKGAQASSVTFGTLAASTDVSEDVDVRGTITTQPEAWFTMSFSHRDIMQHGKVNEQNLLKLLPDSLEDGMRFFKQCLSLNMLNGAAFDKLTADGDSSGNITVARPERFEIGQKVIVDDANSAQSAAGYVRTINMETGVVVIYDARSSGSVINLSAYTVAQSAKVYFDGTDPTTDLGFTSLKSSLLSLANGGSTNLYGQAKTGYPYLQAINISGASVTSANILSKIFDASVTVRNRGKGNPSKAVMSYRNLGYCMSSLESQKGGYHFDQNSTKVSAYGWTEIDIYGPKGKLTVVGIQEIDNDYICFLDMRAIKMYSNGGLRKRIAPDGKEYFESRATTGYSYLVDMCFAGDLVLERPSYCGIMHSIP